MFRAERTQRGHDLAHFHGSGIPEGFSEDKVQLAGDLFEAWGMGRPMFYEGRYGWTATLPGAELENYQSAVFTTIEAPHLVMREVPVVADEKGNRADATPSLRSEPVLRRNGGLEAVLPNYYTVPGPGNRFR